MVVENFGENKKRLSYPKPPSYVNRSFLKLLSISITIYLGVISYLTVISPQPFLTDWMIWGFIVIISGVSFIGGFLLKKRELKKTYLYALFFLVVVMGLGTALTSGIISGILIDFVAGLVYGVLFGVVDCICLVLSSLLSMLLKVIFRKNS